MINFRRRGILSSGGRDHIIQNNNLTNTGITDSEPGIFNRLTARDVPGGIKMSGNVWGYNPLPPYNYYLAGCPLPGR